MITDNTQPWEETTPKSPGFGELVEAIIETSQQGDDQKTSDATTIADASTKLDARLDEMSTTLTANTTAHTSLTGITHQETQATIGLAGKENITRASLTEVSAGTYKHQYATPKLLNIALTKRLAVSFSDYLSNGLFPICSGRKLGRVVCDALFRTHQLSDTTRMIGTWPAGQVSYLFSAEEDFVMFAEFGTGRRNSVHKDNRTPNGVTRINLDNNLFVLQKGESAATTHLTFTPTEDSTTDNIQEVEASLFNPSIAYTPNRSLTARNLNTNKHVFHVMKLSSLNGLPTTALSFLSRETLMVWTANGRLEKTNNVWCIVFDMVCGDIGTPDWYSDEPVKVLSKRSQFVPGKTSSGGMTGYPNASVVQKAAGSAQYLTVSIPLNAIISNFNSLSSDAQTKAVARVNRSLLAQITLAWTGTDTQSQAALRIPFYYTSDTQGYRYYVDVGFVVNRPATDQYTVTLSAANYTTETLPTLNGSTFDMSVPEESRCKTFSLDIDNNPLHPLVFKGCFSETGGHIAAYNAGHRQYLCHYKHNCGNVSSWISQDIEPVIDETLSQITSVGMMSGNHFYSDNLRLLPILQEDDRITYLTRARHPQGAYHYGTFTVNPATWSFEAAARKSDSSEITWIDTNKRYLTDIPVLVENLNLRTGTITSNGLVFSEANGFTGYERHGFNGVNFVPDGVCVIDPILNAAILRYCDIKDPYPIFFWTGEMLFWSVISRTGQQNASGYDACVGSVRVDKQYDESTSQSTIRILPGESMKGMWSTVYEEMVDKRQMIGLDNPSFDDVYHINRDGGKTSLMLVNIPDLPGRYIRFATTQDSRGYRYPSTFNPDKINLKKECAFNTGCPHLLFGSNFAPVLTDKALYAQTADIFEYRRYDTAGNGTVVREYWNTEAEKIPIYGPGEILTINGISHRLNAPISLPINNTDYYGKIYIGYTGGQLSLYTKKHNPLGLTTEPDNTAMLAGYLSKRNGIDVFTYHPIKETPGFSTQPYTNGLLPTIDGRQMSYKASGTTFPFILGLTDGDPKQGYFTKASN